MSSYIKALTIDSIAPLEDMSVCLSVCLQLCDGSNAWACLCHATSKPRPSSLSAQRSVYMSIFLFVCNSATVPKHGPAFVLLHQSTDLSLYRPIDLRARPYRRTMNNGSVSFSPGQSSETVPPRHHAGEEQWANSPVQSVPTLGPQWGLSQVRTRVNTLFIPPA